MGKPVEALINPEILVWARENSGLTKQQVARRLGIPLERLAQMENGSKLPFMGQLRKLANIYKRPIAVFYLSEKPKDFHPLRDFRRTSVTMAFEQRYEIYIEMQRASYRREIALELAEDLDYDIPEFPHTTGLTEDRERVGARIREILDVDIESQTGWRDEKEALFMWRAAIEATGILVFASRGIGTRNIDAENMRGYSIGEFPLPVISINPDDAKTGQIFTLLHEFVHLMLRQSGICDMEETDERGADEQRIEVFCNHGAGAALVPEEVLLNTPSVRGTTAAHLWTDDELLLLSRLFKVSREVVLRRLLMFERTTQELYDDKRRKWRQEYLDSGKTAPPGFARWYRRIVNTAGFAFTNLVLDSYYSDRIRATDLSDYLDMRLRHLPKVEAEARQKVSKFGALF